jgi:hypothetical protein
MSLNEDACLAFIAIAKILTGFHRLSKALVQRVALRYALAVAAEPTKIRHAIGGYGVLQAVHSLGNHLGQCELSRSAWTCKNDRVRKMIAGDHLTQPSYR